MATFPRAAATVAAEKISPPATSRGGRSPSARGEPVEVELSMREEGLRVDAERAQR